MLFLLLGTTLLYTESMRWFDTHCHLDRLPPDADLAAVMLRARNVGVVKIIVPGVTGAPQCLSELKHVSGVTFAWGIHPGFIADVAVPSSAIEPWSVVGYCPVAIGECGLDRRSGSQIEEQERVFRWQLQLALKHGLPVIVHLVGYYQRAFDLLAALPKRPKIVMHSWSGSAEMAKRFVDIGAFVSISGGNLRRPEKLAKLLKKIPPSALLIESDAPDMAPPGWAGVYNEPAVLPQIAATLAEILAVPVAKLSEILYNNAIELFEKGGHK